MRLWLRVFLLSTAAACAAVVLVSVLSMRTGYGSILGSAVESLGREAQGVAGQIDAAWALTRSIAEAYPGNELLPADEAGSLPAWLRRHGSALPAGEEDLELRTGPQAVVFVRGALFAALGQATRPEVQRAWLAVPAYVVRRDHGIPVVYLSAAVRLQNADLLVSVARPLPVLDTFRSSQLSTMIILSFGIVLVIAAATYAGSRAVTARVEDLAACSAAMAAGDYSRRSRERGTDEVAALSRHFNRMACEVETTVDCLRLEKDARQRFVDNLTHELRTPVSSIVGFAELLTLRTRDEQFVTESMARIHREGRRILELTEALKRLLGVRVRPVAFADVDVRAVLEACAAAPRERGFAVGITAEAGRLLGDRALLEMALSNLVDNAIAASPRGLPIELEFSQSDSETVVSVRDHGPGMTDQDLARAGEPFFRGDSGGKPGFGLGLALCKEIAEHHGASLALSRPDDGGLRVSIIFPRLQ